MTGPAHTNTTTAAEVVAKVINEEGGAPGSSLHSWRCEYPDRYGECSCVAETAEEVVKALRTAGLLADPTARTEWGVRCADGYVLVAGDRDDAEAAQGDPIWGHPGPHTLVRRTVTDWTPAEEGPDD